MKVAIMQPYFLPYIGYWQLINAVDRFVVYDDVNFIKRGWINRNQILINGKEHLFSVPLQKVSQNIIIKDTLLNDSAHLDWKNKFIQTISQNYKKAAYYNSIIQLVESIFEQEAYSISDLCVNALKTICIYLHIKTEFVIASQKYKNQEMGKQKRLIDICKQERASYYINAIGGQELYSKNDFAKEGIQLNFIKTMPIEYKQFNNEFIPNLSIIDVMMFNSVKEINEMLDKYELV